MVDFKKALKKKRMERLNTVSICELDKLPEECIGHMRSSDGCLGCISNKVK